MNVEIQSGNHYVPRYGWQMWLDRGFGDVSCKLQKAGIEIFSGQYSEFDVFVRGGPIFKPGRNTFLDEPVVLAEYQSELVKYDFQKNSMISTPVIVASAFGEGKVMLIGGHVELDDRLGPLVESAIRAVAIHRKRRQEEFPVL